MSWNFPSRNDPLQVRTRLNDLATSYGSSIAINAASAASGTNLVYSISGPAWLAINPTIGSITGTAPSEDVDTTATVTVRNAAGSASDTFAVAVTETLAYTLPTLPAYPTNLVTNGDFASAKSWSASAGWTIADGEAGYVGDGATDTNLEQDFSIPSGEVVTVMSITSTNDAIGAVTTQFGGGLLSVGIRRTFGIHAMPATSVGHTRLRFKGQRNWVGALDDIAMYELGDISADPADIYILAGQSNMAGGSALGIDLAKDIYHPLISYMAGNSSSNYETTEGEIFPAVDPLQQAGGQTNGVRPGMAFAREMLASLAAGCRIVLVAGAQGGTSLTGTDPNWEPGTAAPNDLYSNMVTLTQAALADSPSGSAIKGLLWSQGEADDSVNVGTIYPPAFDNMSRRCARICPLPICRASSLARRRNGTPPAALPQHKPRSIRTAAMRTRSRA